MSRYNTIIPNDIVNGEGVCVSFFVQGCPHHCPGCFNEETWDFHGGQEYMEHTKWDIIKAIGANGIQRNFSVLGGEPLAPQNQQMTAEVVDAVRHAYPKIKIFLWTGYEFDDLVLHLTEELKLILLNIDVLIDGQFKTELFDPRLRWKGSSNQRVIDVKKSLSNGTVYLWDDNSSIISFKKSKHLYV